MLEAISTLLSKSFDAFLKLNSKDTRKRKLGKMLFQVYRGLERVITALDNMEKDLKRYTVPNSDAWLFDLRLPEGMILGSTNGDTYNLSLRQIQFDGQVHESDIKTFTKQDLLALAIRRHVTDFSQGVDEFVKPLQNDAEQWYFLEHKPEKLLALGIYDPEIVKL